MRTVIPQQAATIAFLALATALAAACGQQPAAGPDTTADGVGAFGTATGTTQPPPGPTDISPNYPDDPEAYSQAVLAAWTQDQANWLSALTTPEAYDDAVDLLNSVNDQWTFHRCDGTAGSSYCSFINADGDVFTVRISHQLLGQAHAATEASLDKTVYPDESVAYVKKFIEAWQFGNTTRMLLLSSPEVVDKVPDTPPTSVTYLPLDCCGGGLAQVKVKIGNPTARFDVGTTLLGGPNAILDYAVKLGLTL